MDIPDVRYLRTDRGSIAYQRFGEGDRTIVWTAPSLISIETRWSRPGDLQRWESLARIGTVVIFDYRGLGSSERLPLHQVGDRQEMLFDLGAVIHSVGTRPTVLIATGTATPLAVRYAVHDPESLERLILLNAVAYNPMREVGDVEALLDDVVERWGTGEILVRGISLEVEPSQRWQAGHNERIVGTPEVAAAVWRASLETDVTALLEKVAIPTLVIHTGDVVPVTPEHSEAVAAGIPGATFLLRPSSFFNWGDWDRDIHEFITGTRPRTATTRDLAAVMFTDIVASTATASERGDALWRETLGRLDQVVVRVAGDERGRVVKQTGDGHLIEFARPGDAIAAACRLADDVRLLGVDLRTGIHFGEVERRGDGDLGGLAVHLAARIAAEAGPHEILVSRTVAELTLGDGRTYTSRGTPTLKGIPGTWEILSLERE
ncbi:MAG TPA: adenylate/guanylate cyclase domain-containing protein [Acidimicrobiia bacterium]|nr:adenylate/guanylate cyclase domain-containing protein [Acidimicrobiia bacterium]